MFQLAGDFKVSLHILERALVQTNNNCAKAYLDNKEVELCRAGIARLSLHLGDISKDILLAKQIDDCTLFC